MVCSSAKLVDAYLDNRALKGTEGGYHRIARSKTGGPPPVAREAYPMADSHAQGSHRKREGNPITGLLEKLHPIREMDWFREKAQSIVCAKTHAGVEEKKEGRTVEGRTGQDNYDGSSRSSNQV
jgi:hypothetical protein